MQNSTLRRWTIVLTLLIVGVIIATLAAQNPTTRCVAIIDGTRLACEPYALLSLLVLSVGVLAPAVYTLVKQQWTFAWRAAFRSVGWQIAAATFAALVIGLIVTAAEAQQSGRALPGLSVRVVEVVLTLIFGMQASFAFAPDDEPSLEILAACPRPLYYVLLERLILLFTVYGSVATLTGLLILATMSGDNLLLATLRWLAPALMATGIVTRITVLTRRSSFGLLVIILLFLTTLAGGASLVQMFPALTPLYPFLQPNEVSDTLYILNRACLIIGGLALIVSAAWLTRSEERMLKSS